MKLSSLAVAFALVQPVCADVVTYTWDASNPVEALGDDVELTLENSAVKTMTFKSGADRTVRLAGDAVSFAGDAAVGMPEGVVEFTSGLSAGGALLVGTAERTCEWSVSSGSLYLGAQTVVLENHRLDDWEVSSSYLNGAILGVGVPKFERRGDGFMTVQLQSYMGTKTKCVCLKLSQSGNDIVGELLWAKYADGDHVGEDFGMDGYSSYQLPTSGWDFEHNSNFYGCSRLQMVLRQNWSDEHRAIVVSGPFYSEGLIDMAPNATVSVVGDDPIPPAEKWLVNGRLKIVNRADLTLTGTLSGAHGAIEVLNNAPASSPMVAEWPGFVPAEWTLLKANAQLSGLTLSSISAKLGGGSLSPGLKELLNGVVCNFDLAADGQTASCQVQVKPSGSTLVKGCKLEFRQKDVDVEFRVAFAKFIRGGLTPGEVDLDDALADDHRPIAQSVEDTGWGVAAFQCTLGGRAPDVKVAFGEDVVFDNAGLSLSVGAEGSARATVEFLGVAGFPSFGTIDVWRGGVAQFSTTARFPDGMGAITVHEGGKLRQSGMGQSASLDTMYNLRPIVVDGGDVAFGCAPALTSQGNDAVDVGGSTYLNNFTMKNGATYSGKAVRVGKLTDECRWKIEGAEPVTFSQSISLLGHPDVGTSVAFDVDDVTQDGAVDFTLSGDIKTFRNASYQNIHVVKRGAGTMRIDGVTDFERQPVRIENGTWMLGASGTMNGNQNLVLDGGSLSVASGTTNYLGTLSVQKSGTIVLGDNSELGFAVSSGVPWAAGARVTVVLGAGSRLSVGESADGLTYGQQRAFQCDGHRMRLTDEGVFAIWDPGFMLMVR